MKSKQLLWLATITTLILGGCEGQEVSNETLIAVDDLTLTQQNIETETVNNVILKDGIYFAKDNTFSAEDGWMNTVTLQVKEGVLVGIDLNAINQNAKYTKKQTSLNGDYKMVEQGQAQSEWHEQIKIVESYLLGSQSVEELSLTEEGKTDAITGVTINIDDYVSLFKEAIEAGPIEPGPYQDGHYFAKSKDFVQGYQYYVNLIVLNGNIIAINWDGLTEDGTSSKKQDSMIGTYSMVKDGGAQSEWHEQAALMENYLIQTQDPFLITYNENDTTDAVANVSIKVNDFVELAIQALASGPIIEE